MKKLINTSFVYAILAICGGVFYREYTKYMHFDGKTMLAFVHTHLFVLGMIMFLILALFAMNTNLEKNKNFNKFLITYNVGIIGTVIMMIVRGILQVNGTILSSAISSMISGIAGLFHIIITIGLVMLFIMLKNCLQKKNRD